MRCCGRVVSVHACHVGDMGPMPGSGVMHSLMSFQKPMLTSI